MCTIVAFVDIFEDVFDTFHSAANFYIYMAVEFHEKVRIARNNPRVMNQVTT